MTVAVERTLAPDLDQHAPPARSHVARLLDARRATAATREATGSWLLDSPGLASVVAMGRRLARAPGVPVLMQGERGSGLPELARLLHDADPIARTGRFQMTTASLIGPSETLARAPSGTLFVDDIETLRPPAQAWLAELLAGRIDAPRPLRIIAGSRMTARALQGHAGLNQELVHALDVGRLIVPPLRSRPDDILGLARRFLAQNAGWRGTSSLRLSPAAERKLLTLDYPANVRELRNIVERAAALSTSEEIGETEIVVFDEAAPVVARRGLRISRSPDAVAGAAHLPTLADVERDYLVALIRELKGRRTEIARVMAVSYPTVLRKISHYGLDVRAIVFAGQASSCAK